MLRNHENEHQEEWHTYVGPLMYEYHSPMHRNMHTTPFELVPSITPSEALLGRPDRNAPSPDRGTQRAEFLKTLDDKIQKAYGSLRRTQARCKRDLDERI